jgi:hypothetical protein
MKVKILILVFACHKFLAYCNININLKYKSQKNYEVNQTIGQAYLIESTRKNSYFMCLSACNLYQNCLTSVFQKNDDSRICLLYSKIFQESEKSISSVSDLYAKLSDSPIYSLQELNIWLLNGDF